MIPTLSPTDRRNADHHSAPVQRESGPVPEIPCSRRELKSRREAILDGAAEMFAQHGYHGSSLRMISRSVGISHPGMLHHFSSKGDLLGAVIGRLEQRALDAMNRTDVFGSHPDALLKGLAEVLNPSSPSLQLLTTLCSDAVSAEHPGHFRMARLHRVYEHVLEDCFTALAGDGWLRPGIDPEFAARATLATAMSLTVRDRTVRTMQRHTHDDGPVTDLQRLAQSFLVDGWSSGPVEARRPPTGPEMPG